MTMLILQTASFGFSFGDEIITGADDDKCIACRDRPQQPSRGLEWIHAVDLQTGS